MPIKHTDKGWYWGSKGPFSTKEKAEEVSRAAFASGYKKSDNIEELQSLRDGFFNDAGFLPNESEDKRNEGAWVEAWIRYRQRLNNIQALSMAEDVVEVKDLRGPDLGESKNPKPIGGPSTIEGGKKEGVVERLEPSSDYPLSIQDRPPKSASERSEPMEKLTDEIQGELDSKEANYLDKQVKEPFAVATAVAERMGYEDFSEGSPGRAKRDEIAEALKSGKTEKALDALTSYLEKAGYKDSFKVNSSGNNKRGFTYNPFSKRMVKRALGVRVKKDSLLGPSEGSGYIARLTKHFTSNPHNHPVSSVRGWEKHTPQGSIVLHSKEGAEELTKQAPPGPPPREGLQWKPRTSRWIRPETRHRAPKGMPSGESLEAREAIADAIARERRKEMAPIKQEFNPKFRDLWRRFGKEESDLRQKLKAERGRVPRQEYKEGREKIWKKYRPEYEALVDKERAKTIPIEHKYEIKRAALPPV